MTKVNLEVDGNDGTWCFYVPVCFVFAKELDVCPHWAAGSVWPRPTKELVYETIVEPQGVLIHLSSQK